MAEGIAEIANHSPLARAPEGDRWVLVAMSAMRRALEETADLTYVILRNRTDVPFVTSDNPAVVANKFHAMDQGLRNAPTGLGSAGAVLLLPLTPSHSVMWYDASVHTVDDRNGWFDITNAKDVEAINQHQILNCICNVYFSSANTHAWIELFFESLSAERKKPLWKQRYGVPDGTREGAERYRFIQGGRSDEHPKGIIVFWGVPRFPHLWPSFLRWRYRGVAFDTGTGVGVVRRAFMAAHPLQRARTIRINK